MIQRRIFLGEWLLLLILMLVHGGAVYAQTTSFSYQGRFTDGGTAANGTYDMQFKLFDTSSVGAGNQIGSTITNGAVNVNNGVFTVQLDLGATAFPGADRSVEIGVRPAGSGDPYTVLSPRQQLTTTPYAIRALSALSASKADGLSAACNGCVFDANINSVVGSKIIGAIPASSISAGSNNYIQNTNSQQAANFNINGSGTVAGSLAANVVNATTQYNIGGKRALFVDAFGNTFGGRDTGTNASGNTFFGAAAGAVNGFQGNQNSFFGYNAGLVNTDGFQNVFVGAQAGGANTTGANNVFIGTDAGGTNSVGLNNTMIGSFADTTTGNLTNATAIGYTAAVSQSNSLVLGSIKGVGLASVDTNVGIGTPAPAFRLTIKTATSNYGMVHTDGTVTVGTFVGGSTGGGWFGTRSNHSLSFFVNNGGASMTINTGGVVSITTLGSAGSTSLCRNASNQISTCSSSLRYKTNIQPFIGGLSVLNRLRPITFDWKEGGMHDLGASGPRR